MIYLGLTRDDKRIQIKTYRAAQGIEKTIVISGSIPLLVPGADQVAYKDVIMYVTFYRLLQEITPQTLIVLDECLRTQNRYDLAYNCIRNYLNLTSHQLIFQHLPQIDACEDFMILFDFDTRSRWKRHGFESNLIRQEARVQVRPVPLRFERIDLSVAAHTQERYERERERLFAELGSRDPHTLPRQLVQISTAEKRAYVDAHPGTYFLARNKRFRRSNVITFSEAQPGTHYVILDLPHRFIDFADFLYRTGQCENQVLVAGLKVERWYFDRYAEWSVRIHETTSLLS